MSVWFGKFFVFSAFLVIHGDARWSGSKLQMEVHFEWLCQDSEQFIENLTQHWDTISPYVDIKFVPFGKATSLPNGHFVCQHGPLECKGNRFMSCALERIPDNSAQVKFLHCFMSKGNGAASQILYSISTDRRIHDCAAQVGLDFYDTINCFRSNEGRSLQLQAEIATKRNRELPSFVPTILYDNQFNQNLQDNSIVDIKSTVCQVLQQKSIATCPSRRSYAELYDDQDIFHNRKFLGFFKK